jgi:hypothetical protein
MKRIAATLLACTLLGACSMLPEPYARLVATDTPVPTPTVDVTATPIPTPRPTPTPSVPALAAVDAPAFEGEALPAGRTDLFATSGTCAACHTSMTDAAGRDVSFDAAWRSSMMANAARDPYWQASLRGEVTANPALRETIEDKCATCHMPMARTEAATAGEPLAVLDGGALDPDNAHHTAAMDGISCTLCHQIQPGNLGQPQSFSGHYEVETADQREAFGPFPVQDDLATVMQGASGFTPTESAHIQQAETCGTCHTLYTPFVDASGEVAGEFPEQMTYPEWAASSYADERSCQGCHMPLANGGVQLATTGSPQRQPVHQHTFVGGNNTTMALLRINGADMALTASSEQFEATLDRMAAQMAHQAATLVLDNATLDGGTLAVDAALTSMTGHKFPSGFPSRRMWLHVTVLDADGNAVFESGGVDASGQIAGNDNDADGAAFEPHYDTITSPDEVQIYEAIMLTTEGEPTTTLLMAAEYGKDNRLPPPGFDKAGVDPDWGVYGAAGDDANFAGGMDRVHYVVDVNGAQGPFTVEAELLYQSVGYRWAENLRRYDAPETETFFGMMEGMPNLPVVVDAAAIELGG